jgi:GTP-binding protein
MADIPGLIEGASEGVGLGHQFLRHVERNRLLVHILDVGGMTGREPLQDFEVLNRELALYSEHLAQLPQIVALNKIDLVVDSEALEALEATLKARGYTVYPISAATRKGLKPLVYDIMGRLEKMREEAPAPVSEVGGTVHIVAKREDDSRRWEAIQVEDGVFRVTGRGMERLVAMTDLNNEEALRRLQRILEQRGVNRKLKEIGAQDGDTVQIRDIEFEYADEEKRIEARVSAAQRRGGKRGGVTEADAEDA